MSRKIHDQTLATTIAETDRIAFGTGATLIKNILWSAFKTLLLVTNWTRPSLNTGYTAIAYHQVRYRVNKLGQLEISGAVQRTSPPSNDTIFTLDVDARPQAGSIFIPGQVNGATFWIEITVAGYVKSADSSAWSAAYGTHFNAVVNIED